MNKYAVADSNGLVTLINMPTGELNILFPRIGFKEKNIVFQFPVTSYSVVKINFEEAEHEKSEVVVTSTSTSRSIAPPLLVADQQ